MNHDRIHFGSLAESAAALDDDQEKEEMQGIEFEAMQSRTIADVADAPMSEEQKQILRDFDRQREAQSIAVPTDDARVRQMLRGLREPMTLFGEVAHDRRARLRDVLSRGPESRGGRGGGDADGSDVASDSDMMEDEEFYTEGTTGLGEVRRYLSRFSLGRARARLLRQRSENDVPFTQSKPVRKELYQSLKTVGLHGTQIGGTRPLSSCAFSPDSRMLVTGCFSGEMVLWSAPGCERIKAFRGHHSRVDGISWHPMAGLGPSATTANSNTTVHMASGDSDGKVLLWNVDREDPIGELEGHTLRVTKTCFHPSGKYLGTASHDYSWRLWDLETSSELLLQEGHSRGVQSIDFQYDGALAATGGLDGIGRVWDLRTGRSVMLLEGHVNAIPAVAFSPSCYEVATASSDHSVRIHDIRKLKSSLYIIPAHTSLASDVRFHFQYQYGAAGGSTTTATKTSRTITARQRSKSPTARMDTTTRDSSPGRHHQHHQKDSQLPLLKSYYGDFMVTAGFDGVAKIWGCGDWRMLRTLAGHEGKIMSVDISRDGSMVATASYDRTFKIWAREGEPA